MLATNATVSRNRIQEWVQFYDVYNSDGDWIGTESIAHNDVPPVLTPELLVNQEVAWQRGDWTASAVARYVGESQLDNTGSGDLIAPAYFNLDLRASFELARWRAAGRPRMTVYLNNVLDDHDQYPSGYSYQYFTRYADGSQVLAGTPYYYPLAARNFVVTLDFSF
jgi:iron complex outermembrane receptor protein